VEATDLGGSLISQEQFVGKQALV
jgi:hypothetical protein